MPSKGAGSTKFFFFPAPPNRQPGWPRLEPAATGADSATRRGSTSEGHVLEKDEPASDSGG